MKIVQVRTLLGSFLYIIAANIPIWIAGHLFGLMIRGLFGFDFLIIGLLSIYLELEPVLTVTLLLIAISSDLLHCVVKTYLFSVSEFLRSVPGASDFTLSHLWGIAILSFSIAIVCIGVLFAPKILIETVKGQIISILLLFTIFCGVVDFSRGQLPVNHPDAQVGRVRLLRGMIEGFVWEAWNLHRAVQKAPSSKGLIESASSTLPLVRLAAGLGPGLNRPNIVLVLVESWGNMLSPVTGASLIQPYQGEELNSAYKVSFGTVPFYGPTINGETRELCGNRLGPDIMTASASRLRECLPAELAINGYHTTAVHGFSGRMYSRINWYRQARFNETWFREQLEKQGLPLCGGAFTGICDEPISDWIGDRLSQNESVPQFIYWVTLNSHLPVPIPNHLSETPACSMVKGLSDSPAICSWYQLIYNVHRSISRLALREKSRSTIFVIVGDHVPPFSSTQLRGQFSDEVVPYVVLFPKKVEAKLAQLQMIAPSPGPSWAKIQQHRPKKKQTSSKT